MSIDSSRPGGMPAVSELDRQVFEEFQDDRLLLKKLSDNIKISIRDKFDSLSIEDVDKGAVVKEGKRIQKVHFVKERNRGIVEMKKQAILRQYGSLDCECCGFSFSSIYCTLGDDFIECHHIIPLSQLNGI